MKIAFYGSSLLSSYWNGAATYYRGLLRALAGLGHEITFYEPDVHDRSQHRDMEPPDWCKVEVFAGTPEALAAATDKARLADIVVVASGIGYEDNVLRRRAFANAGPGALRIFWDVDAPATLSELGREPDHPLHEDLRAADLVLTYGGGDPVIYGYRARGARHCIPVYNALDPETHFPAPAEPRFEAHLSFLGNRLPDREARVAEFFLTPAQLLPDQQFLLGGSGWEDKPKPPNIRHIGHVGTADHNAFNSSPLAVLNVSRESMAATGFSPATRVFEAAGAAACLITDDWAGLDLFLKPHEEVLPARDGADVAEILSALDPQRAKSIGEQARQRVLAEHTYAKRALQVDAIFRRDLPRAEAAE